MSIWLAALNLTLAAYNAGSMWTLQLMHYPLYALVGANEFKDYIRSNNRRAAAPAIFPAMSAVVFAIVLVAQAPRGPASCAAWVILAMDLGVVASSALLQARLHTELQKDGRSEKRIHRLIATNWIRTALNTFTVLVALYLVFLANRT